MGNTILKMVDGGIKDLNLKTKEKRGFCDSCDYGRNTITEIKITLTKYYVYAEFQDEKVPFSEAMLLFIILRSAEKLMTKSESYFCQWFKNKVNNKYTKYEMGQIK